MSFSVLVAAEFGVKGGLLPLMVIVGGLLVPWPASGRRRWPLARSPPQFQHLNATTKYHSRWDGILVFLCRR